MQKQLDEQGGGAPPNEVEFLSHVSAADLSFIKGLIDVAMRMGAALGSFQQRDSSGWAKEATKCAFDAIRDSFAKEMHEATRLKCGCGRPAIHKHCDVCYNAKIDLVEKHGANQEKERLRGHPVLLNAVVQLASAIPKDKWTDKLRTEHNEAMMILEPKHAK